MQMDAKNLLALLIAGILIAMLTGPMASAQEALRLGSRVVVTGNSVMFTISINNAPNEVQSLGFDVVFDENFLQYTGFTPGFLVATWTAFGVNQIDTGANARLRVGGFTVNTGSLTSGEFPLPTCTTDNTMPCEVPIATTMSGEVVFLTFTVKSTVIDVGGTPLRIENTTDQIQGQAWSIGNSMLLNLDIDGDGQVLPLTDTVLLLRFLSNPNLSDANLVRGNAVAPPPSCKRCTAQEIRAFLQAITTAVGLSTNPALDMDRDGQVLPLTDTVLLLRFLSNPNLSDANLVRGNAVAPPPSCKRCTTQEILIFLQRLLQ